MTRTETAGATALGVILVALGFGAAPSKPVMTAHDGGKTFTVTFPAGALYGCTDYDQRTAGTGDIPYKPSHCWFLDETQTSYQDDWDLIRPYSAEWDVSARIGYPDGPEVPGHSVVLKYVSSNKVRVTR